jgi:predicted dinucleotide-binding enzyme
MKYAIIGSGAIGSALARQFSRKSIPVAVANARGPSSLGPLVDELGHSIKPTELADALKAEMIILAVPFEAVSELLKNAQPWNGRIIVDATNAINYADFSPADLGDRPSTDVIADAAPGARVVKGFNHIWARVLGREPDDGRARGRRVMFVSGNDTSARAEVAELMTTMGFAVIDLGRTDEGGLLQQFGGALTTRSLLMQEIGGASLPEMDLLDP